MEIQSFSNQSTEESNDVDTQQNLTYPTDMVEEETQFDPIAEEEEETQEDETQFDPTVLTPQIARVEMRIWKREDILKTSIAQVKAKVQLDSKDAESLDDKPGIFDHRIFGRSKESISKNSNSSFSVEKRKRMNNWGHIQLPIPIVQPGVTEKRFLQKLIGAEKGDVLKKVVSWDAYIARPHLRNVKNINGKSSVEMSIDMVDGFLENYKENIKVATKRGYISVVNLLNSHKGVYSDNNTVKCEKLIIIDKNLFRSIGDNKSLGDLVERKHWECYFDLLPGSFAIMDLLSDIDVDAEIKYIESYIKGVSEKSREAVTNPDPSIIPTVEVAKCNDIIDRYNSRLRLLVGLKKQNASPTEFVTDVIPIQPAHWRDRSKVVTNGQVKYTQDGINYMYNDIIDISNNIRSLGGCFIPYEDLRDYKSYGKAKKEEVKKKLRDLSIADDVESYMSKIQSLLYDYTMSYKEIENSKIGKTRSLLKRTAGKTDNNRGYVLGKRCDWSGRSVITVDINLDLDEIGIPYDILKVHFKNELMKSLVEEGHSATYATNAIEHLGASYYNPVFNDVATTEDSRFSVSYQRNMTNPDELLIYNHLKEILKTRRYLAIRYPTLHKLNELGYKIKIVFDQTIHLNPLVCEGYNADFDGDQMSVFLLSLPESIKEVDEILAPIKNDMDANGNPTMRPGQDMIMGLYILTLKDKNFKDLPIKGRYSSIGEIYQDLELGKIDLHDKIEFMNNNYKNSLFNQKYYYDNIDKATYRLDFTRIEGVDKSEEAVAISSTSVIEEDLALRTLNFSEEDTPLSELDILTRSIKLPTVSTVGRIIFNTFIPQNLGYVKRVESDVFNPVNYALEWDPDNKVAAGSKELTDILKKVAVGYNSEVNAFVRDLFKSKGYFYVSESGLSISLSDIETVSGRDEAVEEGWKRVEENKKRYVGEELRKANIQVWKDIDKMLTERMMNELPDDNPLKMLATSGARGNVTQIKQMNTIRGIMMDASNREMDTPILKNFSDGLDPVAFTVSSYGSCKGIIDRSNKTAETGDLTRHLTYGLSSVIVSDGDCGDREGVIVKDYVVPNSNIAIALKEDIIGKVPVYDIINKEDNSVLFLADRPVFAEYYKDIEERLDILEEQYGEEGVRLRSVRTCKSPTGCCARCAGYFFAGHSFAKLGDPIGQIAAHAVSERATQLTMRTFHTGGVASGDISAGFAQIKSTIINGNTTNAEIQGSIIPKISLVTFDDITNGLTDVKVLSDLLHDPDVRKSTLSETINGVTYKDLTMSNFGFLHVDLFHDLSEAVCHEIRDSYLLNNISLRSIHFELIAKQMVSNMRIVYSEDSVHRTGEIIKASALIRENLKLAYEGKSPILAIPTLTGYNRLVMDDDNPLTALFFQRAQDGILEYTITAASDCLTNPISSMGIGNTLPTGKGFAYYKDAIRNELDKPALLLSDFVQGFDTTDTSQKTVEEVIEESTEPEVQSFTQSVPVNTGTSTPSTPTQITGGTVQGF